MAAPPYGEISDLLNTGQVVPFLGAGVNFGTRESGAKWDEKTATFLPSGAELSRFLAAKSNFPSQDDRDLAGRTPPARSISARRRRAYP